MRRTRLAKFAHCTWPVAAAALAACSSESRLWRLSPFSDSEAHSSDRANLWPLAWVDRSGGSFLWPLVDYDAHGFAVRPLVSRDRDDLDVLFPLSHFDTGNGEGWALNYYSLGGNRGLFPLANFSRDGWSWVGPAYWSKSGSGDGGGFFPLAHVDDHFGYVATAWWNNDSGKYGLFPLFAHGEFSWYGPLWWNRDGLDVSSFGLFPLVTKGETSWIGPAWRHAPAGGAADAWGGFPLAWSTKSDDAETFTFFPLYHERHDRDGDLHALLVPPTWWQTSPAAERHYVLPFYGHVADAESSLTFALPLFAKSERTGATHWYTLLGDSWNSGADGVAGSGFDVYPLWWSESAGDRSRTMLLPLWYYRERADERLLLTPLGGRGWDASGGQQFVNVLGPLFHHSAGKSGGVDVETTAVLWPLYQHGRSGDTTETRALPFFGVEHSPEKTDCWQLAGLGRYVADRESTSVRAFPFYSQSNAKETPDALFDLTLARRWSNGDAWSSRVAPFYWASGDAKSSEHTALLGLERHATTEEGSAWRFWPFASTSSDPKADGWIDQATLVRHETRPNGDHSTRVFPLYSESVKRGTEEHDALLGLARVAWNDQGRAWRLWPLASGTDAKGLDDWLDPLTLVGVHPHPDKTHVHVGTSLLFDYDGYGEEKRSWNVRTLALMNFGHDEQKPADAANPPDRFTARRDHAGFLFDWFLVEHSVSVEKGGEPHADAHYRLPLVHEYERTGRGSSWDLFCYAVSRERSEATDKFHVFGGYLFQKERAADSDNLHVLGYAYRSDRHGDTTHRDIFPAVTWDSAPDACHVSFLWKLFVYDRKGDQVGGNFLFIPWGHASDPTERDS